MALKVALKSGSWSDSTVWNAGTLPVPGDIISANGFTVTIDQDVNVNRITNSAQSAVTVIPVMTGYTTPSGTVIYSSDNPGNNRLAWMAFDTAGIGTIWQPASGVASWVGYMFPAPIRITRYRLSSGQSTNYTQNPNSWTFEASNDGVTWTILDTVTSLGGASSYSAFVTNPSLYTRYRVNITATFGGTSPVVADLNMYEFGNDTDGVAGGGFIITGSRNIVCTNSSIGVLGGTANTITFSSSGSSTITGNISPTLSDNAARTIVHDGPGTLTITGSILDESVTRNSRTQTVLFSGTGVLNVLGTVNGLQTKTGISITNTGTCNIVGNVIGANAGAAVTVSSNATLNIVGNVNTWPNANGSTHTGVVNITGGTTANISITGNVGEEGKSLIANVVAINASSVLTITGTVFGSFTTTGGYCGVGTSTACRINIIGPIRGGFGGPGVASTSTSAINIFSGPFISHQYGGVPFQVFRMHYRPTSGSYYEFRDNSTNGALSPGAIAPATYLYAPSTVIAAPNQNDVRFGTVYASGSQTGQMRVPLPSQVSVGIPVDNTVGTAVLSANDVISAVWNSSIAELTASNSIGNRLKNVSTPDITANQIIGLI